MGREGCGAGYADLCSKAGKDAIRLSGYTWHSNRHTFASRLVTSAWSLARYSRLAPEFLGEAADRLVVTLLHLEEKSVAEVRARTGWSTALVKVRAFRARKKLQKILAQLEKRL